MVCGLSPICSPSGTPIQCTYYVCDPNSLVGCPVANITAFPTLAAAMESARTEVPENAETTFFVSYGTTAAPYSVPRKLQSLKIVGVSADHSRVAVACPNFDSAETTQTLRLQLLELSATTSSAHNCLNLTSSGRLSLKVQQVTFNGPVNLVGGADSNFAIRFANFTAPADATTHIAVVDGFFALEFALVTSLAKFSASGHTSAYVSSVTFEKRFTLALGPTSSAMVSLSQFKSTADFLYASTLQNYFVPPPGSLDRQLLFLNNVCNDSATFSGEVVSADIRQNEFYGVKGEFEKLMLPPKNENSARHPVVRLSPTLVLSAQCVSNVTIESNDFASGTFYVDLPLPSNAVACAKSIDSEKTGSSSPVYNPYFAPNTIIRKNRFSSSTADLPPNKKILCPRVGSGQDLCEAMLPAVSITASISNQLADIFKTRASREQFIVDLSGNWWGTGAGPWTCCNPNSLGSSFTTPLLNASLWCTDPKCHSTSPTVLPPSCIMSGCEVKYPKGGLAVLIVVSVLALLLLLSTIVAAVYILKKHFSVAKIEVSDQQDLIEKLLVPWRRMLIVSAIGVLLNWFIIGSILGINGQLKIAPGQFNLRPTTVAAYGTLLATATLQLLANLIVVSLNVPRRQGRDRFFGYYYALTIFLVCTTVFSSLLWIPAEYLNESRLEGNPTKTITVPSPLLSYLIYVAIAINLLSGICSIIPTHLINHLANNYEYARINTALELSLLKNLAASPAARSKAKLVRAFAAIGVVIALALIFFSIAGMAKPENYYNKEARSLAPRTLLRIRIGLETGYTLLALLACLGAIVATYYQKNRIWHLTALIIMTLCCIFSSIFAIYLWVSLLTTSAFVSETYVAILVPLHSVFLITLSGLIISLFRLRKYILDEIPAIAYDALNDHLDSTWNSNRPANPVRRNGAQNDPLSINASSSTVSAAYKPLNSKEDADFIEESPSLSTGLL